MGRLYIRYNKFIKAVALLVLFVFTFNTFTQDYAYAIQGAIPQGVSELEIPIDNALIDIFQDFSLPSYMGEIDNSYDPYLDQLRASITKGKTNFLDSIFDKVEKEALHSDKVIIHIQDAHCNYDAQIRISEIIDHISNKYDIKNINLEGGVGEYDLSVYQQIENTKKRKNICDLFVQDGEMTGAELFTVMNPEKADLHGIEDTDLYINNLKAYKEISNYSEEIELLLSSLETTVKDEKEHIFNEKLKEFDAAYNKYISEEMEFTSYLLYLINKSKEEEIDINELQNIVSIFDTIKDEGAIDFEKAENERDEVIDELFKSLSKVEKEELIIKTLSFQENRALPGEFYEYLKEKSSCIELDLDVYPDLKRYINYITKYEKINERVLFKEIEDLENKLKSVLTENDREMKLLSLSSKLALSRSILSFQLTIDKYREYSQDEELFVGSDSKGLGIEESLDKMSAYLKTASVFYAYSFKRDEAFLQNIKFSKTNYFGKEAAILVTGGFHTENLERLLKENNISYLSIVPRFNNCDEYECPYFNILNGELSEQYKEAKQLFKISSLAIASMNNKLGRGIRAGKVELYDVIAALRIAKEEGSRKAVVGGEEYDIRDETSVPAVRAMRVEKYAASLYQMEKNERLPVWKIKQRFNEIYNKEARDENIFFNLNEIGLLKEGSIRYYTYSEGAKVYAIRIFDKDDKEYLHPTDIVQEGSLEGDVRYQIISREEFERVIHVENTPLKFALMPVLLSLNFGVIVLFVYNLTADKHLSVIGSLSYFFQTAFLSLFTLSIIFLLIHQLHFANLARQMGKYLDKQPVPKSMYSEEDLPVVTIQLPIYNEANVVERLIDSAVGLDYPLEKLEIQILDDSTDMTRDIVDEKIEKIRKELVSKGKLNTDGAQDFIKVIRRPTRTGYKGGALALGTRLARGDYIAIFDADFVINEDFLQKSIHYFNDAKVCVVQGVWGYLNENQSFLTKLQALGLAGHMFVEQTVKNRRGHYVHFHGTAGIWRKEAIEKSGGWQIDTVTEDGDLSYRAQIAVYKIIYLDNLIVPSELPTSMTAFKSQQLRWTKGAIQVMRKVLVQVWKSDESLSNKMEVTLRLVVSLSAFPAMFMFLFLWPASVTADLCGVGGAFSVLFASFVIISMIGHAMALEYAYMRFNQEEYKNASIFKKMKYMLGLGALGIALLPVKIKAIFEAFFDRESIFVRTPKTGDKKKNVTINYKVAKDLVVILSEFILGVYSIVFLIEFGILGHSPMIVYFFGQFAAGFFWVAIQSLRELIGKDDKKIEQEDSLGKRKTIVQNLAYSKRIVSLLLKKVYEKMGEIKRARKNSQAAISINKKTKEQEKQKRRESGYSSTPLIGKVYDLEKIDEAETMKLNLKVKQQSDPLELNLVSRGPPSEEQKKSIIKSAKNKKQKALLESLLNLLPSDVELVVFKELYGDLYGFADPESKMIGLHKSIASTPSALLHEIGEYLAQAGIIKMKFRGKLVKFIRFLGIYVFFAGAEWLKADIIATDAKGEEIGELTINKEALSIAIKNTSSRHYILRAIQREMFGKRDEILTNKIKENQKKGAKDILPLEDGKVTLQEIAKAKVPGYIVAGIIGFIMIVPVVFLFTTLRMYMGIVGVDINSMKLALAVIGLNFFSIWLHETGHEIAAKISYGSESIKYRSISMVGIKYPDRVGKEFMFIFAAGAGINFVLSIMVSCIGLVTLLYGGEFVSAKIAANMIFAGAALLTMSLFSFMPIVRKARAGILKGRKMFPDSYRIMQYLFASRQKKNEIEMKEDTPLIGKQYYVKEVIDKPQEFKIVAIVRNKEINQQEELDLSIVSRGPPSEIKKESIINSAKKEKQKVVLRSILKLLPQDVELVVYKELHKDMFGFARPENKIIGLHESIADDPVALFHEVGEYLIKEGLVSIEVQERFLTFYNNATGENIGQIELQGAAFSIYEKDPGKIHYLIRAFQRQTFGRKDANLTKKIKRLQVEINNEILKNKDAERIFSLPIVENKGFDEGIYIYPYFKAWGIGLEKIEFVEDDNFTAVYKNNVLRLSMNNAFYSSDSIKRMINTSAFEYILENIIFVEILSRYSKQPKAVKLGAKYLMEHHKQYQSQGGKEKTPLLYFRKIEGSIKKFLSGLNVSDSILINNVSVLIKKSIIWQNRLVITRNDLIKAVEGKEIAGSPLTKQILSVLNKGEINLFNTDRNRFYLVRDLGDFIRGGLVALAGWDGKNSKDYFKLGRVLAEYLENINKTKRIDAFQEQAKEKNDSKRVPEEDVQTISSDKEKKGSRSTDLKDKNKEKGLKNREKIKESTVKGELEDKSRESSKSSISESIKNIKQKNKPQSKRKELSWEASKKAIKEQVEATFLMLFPGLVGYFKGEKGVKDAIKDILSGIIKMFIILLSVLVVKSGYDYVTNIDFDKIFPKIPVEDNRDKDQKSETDNNRAQSKYQEVDRKLQPSIPSSKQQKMDFSEDWSSSMPVLHRGTGMGTSPHRPEINSKEIIVAKVRWGEVYGPLFNSICFNLEGQGFMLSDDFVVKGKGAHENSTAYAYRGEARGETEVNPLFHLTGVMSKYQATVVPIDDDGNCVELEAFYASVSNGRTVKFNHIGKYELRIVIGNYEDLEIDYEDKSLPKNEIKNFSPILAMDLIKNIRVRLSGDDRVRYEVWVDVDGLTLEEKLDRIALAGFISDDIKLLSIYETMSKHTVYNGSYAVLKYDGTSWGSTWENVLSTGERIRLVCRGTAGMFALLAKRLGMESGMVLMNSLVHKGDFIVRSGVPHAMGLIKANGKWQLVETTKLMQEEAGIVGGGAQAVYRGESESMIEDSSAEIPKGLAQKEWTDESKQQMESSDGQNEIRPLVRNYIASRNYTLHTVKPGESLSSLAEYYYGKKRYYAYLASEYIYYANENILPSFPEDHYESHIIWPGQQLRIPFKTYFHEVEKGETLWGIADLYYGGKKRTYSNDPNRIIRDNYLSGPSIQPGEVLRVKLSPEEAIAFEKKEIAKKRNSLSFVKEMSPEKGEGKVSDKSIKNTIKGSKKVEDPEVLSIVKEVNADSGTVDRKVTLHVLDETYKETYFNVARKRKYAMQVPGDAEINVYITEGMLKTMKKDPDIIKAVLLHEILDTGEADAHAGAWQAVKTWDKKYRGGMSKLLLIMIMNLSITAIKELVDEYEGIEGQKRIVSGEWDDFEDGIYKILLNILDRDRMRNQEKEVIPNIKRDKVKNVVVAAKQAMSKVRFPSKKVIIFMPEPVDNIDLFNKNIKAWSKTKNAIKDGYEMGNVMVKFFDPKDMEKTLDKAREIKGKEKIEKLMFMPNEVYERWNEGFKEDGIYCIRENFNTSEYSKIMVATHIVLGIGLLDLKNRTDDDSMRKELISDLSNLLKLLGAEAASKAIKENWKDILDGLIMIEIKPYSEELSQHLLAVEQVSQSV